MRERFRLGVRGKAIAKGVGLAPLRQMPYPTKEEFDSLLLTEDHAEILEAFVFAAVPYAFRSAHEEYGLLRSELSRQLGVALENIRMTGSGSIGFSLAPYKYGQVYSEQSDWDMLLVDAELFDCVWIDLVSLTGEQYRKIEWRTREHLRDQIYWGWLVPDTLAPATRVARPWFEAFHGLSRHVEFAGRTVAGRLYRTWDHARAYHLYGLREIAKHLGRTPV